MQVQQWEHNADLSSFKRHETLKEIIFFTQSNNDSFCCVKVFKKIICEKLRKIVGKYFKKRKGSKDTVKKIPPNQNKCQHFH